ncbi:unnamed protein product [Soboliphyme baturini]|uniref:Ribosomal_L7Ae domain-containing protein n=1 Tax=Soboliphyme baturini TaxID=241478 RepID=A0A183IKW5_9BILA|nr:unnamed protein product [Soboliphyme baturini]
MEVLPSPRAQRVPPPSVTIEEMTKAAKNKEKKAIKIAEKAIGDEKEELDELETSGLMERLMKKRPELHAPAIKVHGKGSKVAKGISSSLIGGSVVKTCLFAADTGIQRFFTTASQNDQLDEGASMKTAEVSPVLTKAKPVTKRKRKSFGRKVVLLLIGDMHEQMLDYLSAFKFRKQSDVNT